MDFVALDVETANPSLASICSVGLVRFRNGEPSEEWESTVNPGTHFDAYNVRVHGITPGDVRNSPKLLEILDLISNFINQDTVVSHGHFDRVAISQATSRKGITTPDWKWLDTTKVARRTWAECAQAGYGLKPLCKRIGLQLRHHNALEDSRAAGLILVAAMRETGMNLLETIERSEKPISPSSGQWSIHISIEGNPDGPLFGETVVFTGTLTFPRQEAASLAAALGCRVAASMSKKVSLLVVGGDPMKSIPDEFKSSKHKKAEELISTGHDIRIIYEEEFMQMMQSS